jgi:CheY-like chemotaxis protein
MGMSPKQNESLSVLVVDDSADNAGILATLLEDEGHRVRVAHDGVRCLELFEEEAPHLIVLDLGLPKMDGFEVATEMRKRYGDDFRIVALTGYSGEAARARAERSGIDSFLTKPVFPRQLKAILDVAPKRRVVCRDSARQSGHSGL